MRQTPEDFYCYQTGEGVGAINRRHLLALTRVLWIASSSSVDSVRRTDEPANSTYEETRTKLKDSKLFSPVRAQRLRLAAKCDSVDFNGRRSDSPELACTGPRYDFLSQPGRL